MPVFNARDFLKESIESVLNQSFCDYEFIIVDDCSTDGSDSLIKKYALLDKRIKFFQNSENLGIAANRNKCFKLSTGNYVAWQDADDISLPKRMQHQIDFLENNKSVGIVGGVIQLFNSSGILGIRKYPNDDAGIRRYIYRYSTIAQPAMMLRRDALLQAGSYNLKFPPAEDLDMTFRVGQNWRLANLNEVIVRYRVNKQSATLRGMRKMEVNSSIIRRKYFKTKGFKATYGDRIFCFMHLISIYTVPSRLKYFAFNLFRNDSYR